jgi:L-ascorbate metabolism protein UlaG (beta-lactamase superfamily)
MGAGLVDGGDRMSNGTVRGLILIVILVAVMLGEGDVVRARDTLRVTYVGNTGFVVQGKQGKVIIDGLLGSKGAAYYDMPSDSIVSLMRSARPPFGDIDIIAVTHWHDDHFDASVVAQHMIHNPRSELLCTRQVADRLATQPDYAVIERRVTVVDIPVDSVVPFAKAGISARILSSMHGSYYDVDSAGETVDIHRETVNLEFLFDLGGQSVFHCGDAAMPDRYRYRLLGLGQDSLDVAFVQTWSCQELPSFREKLVREELLPRRIFFTHMAPGRAARLAADSSCLSYRGVTIPTHHLESWTIPSAR